MFNFFKKETAKINLGYNPFYHSKFVNAQIDKEMYMNFAISSCFDEISRSFKSLEFGVYKNKNGNYIKSNSYEAKKIKKTIKKPNPHINFSLLTDSYLTAIYFSGNCLIRRVRGVINDDIYIYSNGYFQVDRFPDSLLIKSIRVGDQVFSGDELKDFKLITEFNPFLHLQGVANGRARLESLEPIKKLINGTVAYNISIMMNGGSLGGILNFDEPSTDSTQGFKEMLIEQFKSLYTGAGNAGKIFLSWGKSNYQPVGTTPKDLDYIDSIKELQKIVCRKMGVPETLIIGDNSSYNNTLEFKKKLYTELIIPLAKEFCEHLTSLFQDTLAEDEEFYFSTSNIKVLQPDVAKEIKELTEALTGFCTVNNIIKIINDKYQMELEDIGEQGNVVLTKYNYSLKDVGYSEEPQTEPNSEGDSGE